MGHGHGTGLAVGGRGEPGTVFCWGIGPCPAPDFHTSYRPADVRAVHHLLRLPGKGPDGAPPAGSDVDDGTSGIPLFPQRGDTAILVLHRRCRHRISAQMIGRRIVPM